MDIPDDERIVILETQLRETSDSLNKATDQVKALEVLANVIVNQRNGAQTELAQALMRLKLAGLE